MPRFFLHVRNDDFFAKDEEGGEFENLDAACREARKTLGAVIAEELAADKNLIHLTIMIEDSAGQRAASLTAVTHLVSSEDPFTD